MNQTVPIEQNATFRCNGTQDPVWIVNIATGMRFTTDRLRDIRLLREIGITSQRRRNGELLLMVLATVANNNSNVTCRVFVSDAVNFSHVAKLTVLGGSLLLLHFCLFVCMQYCLSNCRQQETLINHMILSKGFNHLPSAGILKQNTTQLGVWLELLFAPNPNPLSPLIVALSAAQKNSHKLVYVNIKTISTIVQVSGISQSVADILYFIIKLLVLITSKDIHNTLSKCFIHFAGNKKNTIRLQPCSQDTPSPNGKAGCVLGTRLILPEYSCVCTKSESTLAVNSGVQLYVNNKKTVMQF